MFVVFVFLHSPGFVKGDILWLRPSTTLFQLINNVPSWALKGGVYFIGHGVQISAIFCQNCRLYADVLSRHLWCICARWHTVFGLAFNTHTWMGSDKQSGKATGSYRSSEHLYLYTHTLHTQQAFTAITVTPVLFLWSWLYTNHTHSISVEPYVCLAR